jgi:hypothetical protein
MKKLKGTRRVGWDVDAGVDVGVGVDVDVDVDGTVQATDSRANCSRGQKS